MKTAQQKIDEFLKNATKPVLMVDISDALDGMNLNFIERYIRLLQEEGTVVCTNEGANEHPLYKLKDKEFNPPEVKTNCVFIVERYLIADGENALPVLDSVFSNEEAAKNRCERMNVMKDDLGIEYAYTKFRVFDED